MSHHRPSSRHADCKSGSAFYRAINQSARPRSSRVASSHLDLIALRERLIRLREVHNHPIQTLQGQNKADYEYIRALVASTYDADPHAYEQLYNQIQEVFVGIKPVPSLVSGYMVGCLDSAQFSEGKGCTVTCVRGVPDPKNTGFQFCQYLVIHQVGYDFNVLNADAVADRTNAYLFITADSLEQFPGLTVQEKAKLQAFGVHNVMLVARPQHDVYQQLTPVFVPLAEIKTRPSPGPAPSPAGATNWWAIILVLIAILIIFWIAARSLAC